MEMVTEFVKPQITVDLVSTYKFSSLHYFRFLRESLFWPLHKPFTILYSISNQFRLSFNYQDVLPIFTTIQTKFCIRSVDKLVCDDLCKCSFSHFTICLCSRSRINVIVAVLSSRSNYLFNEFLETLILYPLLSQFLQHKLTKCWIYHRENNDKL